MRSDLLLLLSLLVAISLFLLLAYGVYWVPTRVGYRKIGLALVSVFAGLSLAIAILCLFEDQLFTQAQARELLAQQDLRLQDRFEILENKSLSGIGDYYHTFTLQISAQDKDRLTTQLKGADNYAPSAVAVPDITQLVDRYRGEPLTQHYENEMEWVSKLYKPLGPGYAPTYHVITISKQTNKLVFEDITE